MSDGAVKHDRALARRQNLQMAFGVRRILNSIRHIIATCLEDFLFLRSRGPFAERIEQLAIAWRRRAAIAGVAQLALVVAGLATGSPAVGRIAEAQALERLVQLALSGWRLIGRFLHRVPAAEKLGQVLARP